MPATGDTLKLVAVAAGNSADDQEVEELSEDIEDLDPDADIVEPISRREPLRDDPDTSPAAERPSARSIIQISVNIDSSLDTEKLEKQLALLRRYGAI